MDVTIAVTIAVTFSRHELVDLNLIRFYLRATTVSDIALADGRALHSWTWRGVHIPDRNGRFTVPRYEEPTQHQRSLWRKLLRKILQPDATSTQLSLVTPLGPRVAASTSTWGGASTHMSLISTGKTLENAVWLFISLVTSCYLLGGVSTLTSPIRLTGTRLLFRHSLFQRILVRVLIFFRPHMLLCNMMNFFLLQITFAMDR
jgi:hypothetical protein